MGMFQRSAEWMCPFSLFWLESNFRIKFIFPECVYITFSSPLSLPFDSKVCDWNFTIPTISFGRIRGNNCGQNIFCLVKSRWVPRCSTLGIKWFCARKQRGVKMHHWWSGGGLRFYRVRDSTYFSEFVKISYYQPVWCRILLSSELQRGWSELCPGLD